MASRTYVWTLCSEYNRRKYADHAGYVACVSCGTVKPWSEMDAGHFVAKKKGKAIYWLPENIHPQCTGCNRNTDQENVKINYTIWMIKKYGMDRLELLREKARTTSHESQTDIEDWLKYYKTALKALA